MRSRLHEIVYDWANIRWAPIFLQPGEQNWLINTLKGKHSVSHFGFSTVVLSGPGQDLTSL